MSAFDIAGAVVWTPLAVLWWLASLGGVDFGWFEVIALHKNYIGEGVLMSTAISLVAAFCWARLFGATL